MNISILQIMACTTLAVVSIQRRLAHPRESAFRHLLPFIAAAGGLGLLLVFPLLDLFVAYYSGSLYEMESMSYRYNGPYWWAYWSLAIFPLLPLLGLIPFIGKRPILMTAIAVLAMLTVVHATVAQSTQ